MANNVGSKRGLDPGQTSSSPGSSGPPSKRMMTQFESVKIGQISTLEELDMKVLQFQNKKLTERIEQRRRAEEELRKRIEQLQQRQTTDDAVLVIVNRYWNQLDEDVRVLLQRFDAEAADENENKNESEAVTSFVALLSTWDKQEIEQKLGQRVEFSKRAIGKLLQAYDRLLQRNGRLLQAIKDSGNDASKVSEDATLKEGVSEGDEESKDKDDTETVDGDKDDRKEKDEKILIEDAVKQEITELQTENKRLHELVTQLHQRHHETTLKNREVEEKLTAAETELAESRNNIEELEYDLNKANQKVDKQDRYLAEAASRLRCMQEGTIKVEGGSAEGVSKVKFQEILHELEEQRELATNRFTELEKLQKDHCEALKEVEKLKMDLSHLPEAVVVDTTEYKCLQSQFSVLYNEIMQMKTQLEETRNLLQSSKNTHLRQTEQMESDELACQKKLRTEVIQLEDTLAQNRKEHEMLRIEFEQTMAANEQTGPINREMRNLITSLKNHNEQLKGEISRYKRKLREAQNELAKLKSGHAGDPKREDITSPKHQVQRPHVHSEQKLKTDGAPVEQKKEDSAAASTTPKLQDDLPIVLKDEEENKEEKEREKGKTDADIIKDLKAQLKKSQDSQKEMKLLLDMYKSAPKEQRDKVQLMSAEKKAKQEIEDLKSHIRKMQEAERRERRKLAEDDALRKIKKMEESIQELTKNLHAQKQEEEALLNEMEVTGQAFEDMQEQNIRLLQQLKEKDDANFKLMSERIKSNQIHKLLKEEKDVLAEQVAMLLTQVEAQNLVVRKLEDKERILQNNLATVEKESSLRQQAMEMHKRKAVESSQTAADLKLHLDKYHAQLKDAQIVVAEKTSALEQNSFKHKRMQEDVAILRRKLERAKKIEVAGTADEVLMEEIREYKEQLTCPSCKVKKKDAVLTKCFHVFCLECLKTRYETRQRKCPKCNAAFGANDFHRIYLY